VEAKEINLDVVDASGNKISSRAVRADVFAAEVLPTLLHQVVRWQRAKRRAGTHSVQTRAEMTGGGKKPWKQKGTGSARAGSNTSPLWVGGGVAHGPKVRKYEFRLNKEERRKALRSALSARCSEGRITVLDSFKLSAVKTAEAAKVLKALGIIAGKRTLVVIPENDETLVKSLRNIAGVKVLTTAGVNVYDVMIARRMIVLDAALDRIQDRLSSGS